MPSRNTPRLASTLIARKGEAAPTAAAAANAPAGVKSRNVATPDVPHGTNGTIAVSVRLDPARYERLKIFGVHRRLTNQEIIVASLDAYLGLPQEPQVANPPDTRSRPPKPSRVGR